MTHNRLVPLLSRPALDSHGAYYRKVLSLSPIAYWPLYDLSGVAAVNLVSPTLNGVYAGVDPGQSQPPFIVPYFDGVNDYCNIYSAGLNALKAFFSEGSLVIWAKVENAAVWTDGTAREVMRVHTSSGLDVLAIQRSTVNGALVFYHTLGGTAKSVTIGSLSYTTWMHLAITVSDSGDAFKAYINGAQVGATQTGLGTQSANNLVSNLCNIGATNSTGPTGVWKGWPGHAALFDRPLSAAEVGNLYDWAL